MYREAVNAAHAQVRSGPQSPVRYNAFDPQLQLWVASCMAAVFEDTRRLQGGRSRRDPDTIHRAASVFATTLQVPPEMWPADREAADRYWQEQLDRLDFDDRMRSYLIGIARLDFLPAPVSALFGGWNLFMTLGYLPPQLRESSGSAGRPRSNAGSTAGSASSGPGPVHAAVLDAPRRAGGGVGHAFAAPDRGDRRVTAHRRAQGGTG